ncbi:MAG: glycoside hydrolase family 5 protein [Clostridia bacterium]|nr:glycoside hydrolase family 5 protein [Clostridia bacterium]
MIFLTGLPSCAYDGDIRQEPLKPLICCGEKIYDSENNEVTFRGVNLGGWLIQEDWFCPADNGKKGDHYTLETLVSRFGKEKAYELYNIYWDNWITEYDFSLISGLGFNCVRIPFWYRNFQSDDNGTWIVDEKGNPDFSRLDWAVEMCRKYNLYAILDFHGANGCQGMQDHCGQAGNCRFFEKGEKGEKFREQALEMWALIAERYKGKPEIAMFDLLNEPLCDVPRFKRDYKSLNKFYDDAYKIIRKTDPARIVCMEGIWDIGKLPDPGKVNWENVVYQLHLYNGTEQSVENRIYASKYLKYNVPLYVGEFHPTGENITLTVGEMLDTFEKNGVNWTVWTWKGYNSWAAWADWFIYGSVDDILIVNPETDSFEEIAEKWSSIKTDGGAFYSGHLDEEVVPFLPYGKTYAEETDNDKGIISSLKKTYHRIQIFFELIIDYFI